MRGLGGRASPHGGCDDGRAAAHLGTGFLLGDWATTRMLPGMFEVERVRPVELGGVRVTAAAAGSSHSAVVTGDGTLLASAGLLPWS